MGRPGYEDDFRKKLEARDIKPRVDSWNKLEEQLESTEKAGETTRKWWPGIVAACACLMLFFSFIFQPSSDAELVVEQQEKNTKEDTQFQPSFFENEKGFPESVVTEATHAEVNESLVEPAPIIKSGITDQDMDDFQMSETAWMQQEEAETLLAKQMEELGLADLLLAKDISDQVLWQKLDELLAQASKLQESSGQVSDAEIDALLLLAAEDISRSRPNQGTAVSAETLLYEVEMELEETFRQRVFDLLKQGLDKTRTAVVNSMQ